MLPVPMVKDDTYTRSICHKTIAFVKIGVQYESNASLFYKMLQNAYRRLGC